MTGFLLLCTGSVTNMRSEVSGEVLNSIEDVHSEWENDSLCVIIELTEPVIYSIKNLSDPPRVAVDLPGVKTSGPVQSVVVEGGLLRSIRWAQLSLEPLVARVVLDLENSYENVPDYQVNASDNELRFNFQSTRESEAPRQGYHERDVERGEPIIDLTVKDAGLESVLHMISENYGLNIITDGKLKGTVSTKLKGVSIDDALSAILRTRGYDYVRQGEIIIVKESFNGKSDMVTRLFKLDYADADALKEACEKLVSKEGNIAGFSRNLLERSESHLSEDRIFKERKDVLMVTDYPGVVHTIGEMVHELDVPLPQVMIEVKFIEKLITEADDLGINWHIEGEFTGRPPVDPALLALTGSTGEIETYNKMFKDGDFTFGQLKLHQFSTILQLLEQSGNARLLSNPRVATLDNHEARINVGTKILIPIRERGTTSDVILESFEEMEIGISLIVIPHVHQNGDITLQLQPRVEEITSYTGEFNDRPIIAERTATTQIKVKDGDTITIGGLIRESEVETVKRVPFVGRIPVLKYLFTHKSRRVQNTDLLIFITPRVMPTGIS